MYHLYVFDKLISLLGQYKFVIKYRYDWLSSSSIQGEQLNNDSFNYFSWHTSRYDNFTHFNKKSLLFPPTTVELVLHSLRRDVGLADSMELWVQDSLTHSGVCKVWSLYNYVVINTNMKTSLPQMNRIFLFHPVDTKVENNSISA